MRSICSCLPLRGNAVDPATLLLGRGEGQPDLLLLLDTGHRVPQRQQPLAAELGCVQFLVRRDDNLALIRCGRRLAAEGDSVTTNDVDAHGWGLLFASAQCRR